MRQLVLGLMVLCLLVAPGSLFACGNDCGDCDGGSCPAPQPPTPGLLCNGDCGDCGDGGCPVPPPPTPGAGPDDVDDGSDDGDSGDGPDDVNDGGGCGGSGGGSDSGGGCGDGGDYNGI